MSYSYPSPANIYVRELIVTHMDDTWEQWVVKLKMFGMARDWMPMRNPIVKKGARGREKGKFK